MDLTTLIYQHVVAALLATSGASAVIGWLGRHWRVIGRVWNGVVAVAGLVRKLGPAPATPADLVTLLKEADPQTLITFAQALNDALKDRAPDPSRADTAASQIVHSNLP